MQTDLPRQSTSSSLLARALLLTFAGACLMLAACNTTEGAGRDIQSAGRGIEDVAQDAKR